VPPDGALCHLVTCPADGVAVRFTVPVPQRVAAAGATAKVGVVTVIGTVYEAQLAPEPFLTNTLYQTPAPEIVGVVYAERLAPLTVVYELLSGLLSHSMELAGYPVAGESAITTVPETQTLKLVGDIEVGAGKVTTVMESTLLHCAPPV
jgi:hypothetical protein